MPEVFSTARASQQAAALRGPHAKAYQEFLNDLQHRGCAALGYRLTGEDPVDRLCVKHLRGTVRVVVAFRADDSAWIVLIGPHDDHDPHIDVYTELWQTLSVKPPSGQRLKPPCCGPIETPPALEQDLVEEIVAAARHRRR